MDILRFFNSRTRVFSFVVVVLIASGTVGFRMLEDWTWIQSFYFTVSTLTTVGYGDLVPTTEGSRLAAAIFMLFGIVAFITVLSLIEARVFQRHQQRSPRPTDANLKSDQ